MKNTSTFPIFRGSPLENKTIEEIERLFNVKVIKHEDGFQVRNFEVTPKSIINVTDYITITGSAETTGNCYIQAYSF